jgi:4-amino-4-deoxy-L-arabinose transferase-like glycosyltransferase
VSSNLMPGDRPAALSRRTIALAAVLCALGGLWTLYRGAVLRLEYFDGYAYLMSAKRLAGDETVGLSVVRPPLVALLHAPALALARMGAPANLGYTLAPHLLAACLSVAAAGALFVLFRSALGTGGALMGAALFVTGRFFVRYGAFTLADLPATGLAVLTVHLYVRALDGRRWRDDVYAGLAFGLTIASKYPLVLMGGVLVIAEALIAWRERRLSLRRVLGLAVTLALGAVVFAMFMAGVYLLAHGITPWAQMLAFFERDLTGNAAMQATSLEHRRDYAVMTAAAVAWPVLALAVVGLVRACMQRRRHDLVFLAWLFGLATPIVLVVPHTEARYLLPLVPPLLYFAVRAVDWLVSLLPRPWMKEAAVGVCLLTSSFSGARQAWADSDPLFVSDVQRLTARAVHTAQQPGGRLGWQGGFACLYPQRRIAMPADEFFNVFHFHTGSIQYFIGKPVQGLPLAVARPGDVVVVPPPNCSGLALPKAPVRDFEVYKVAPQGRTVVRVRTR